jgi:hypothetical protein
VLNGTRANTGERFPEAVRQYQRKSCHISRPLQSSRKRLRCC